MGRFNPNRGRDEDGHRFFLERQPPQNNSSVTPSMLFQCCSVVSGDMEEGMIGFLRWRYASGPCGLGGSTLFSLEMNPSKRFNQVPDKDSAEAEKDIMTTSGQIQPLKIPDAVVALAQAAAKANGETEKCMSCLKQFVNNLKPLLICSIFLSHQLTVDEAKTILSFLDVVVEGVTGSSILTALTAWMCKPGYASLPVVYARAGSELLDLIQTKASLHLHVSSNELFNVLDEASENTFLSTNTTANIQKFLFDGEADKVATELKNVVACASYMLEKKLIEAWSNKKTAEALRCQKLLVEEEEAIQKRHAELLERKRLKKVRQKEQRLKDLTDEEVTAHLSGSIEDASGFPKSQSLEVVSDLGHYEQEDPQYSRFQAQDDNSFHVDQSVEEAGCDIIASQESVLRHHKGSIKNLAQNNIFSSMPLAPKHPARHSSYRDPKACTLLNRNKTWEWKVRSETEEQCPKNELDINDGHGKNSRVIIGSISVAIHDDSEHSQNFGDPKHDLSPSSSMIIDNSVIEMMEPLSHKESKNNGKITPEMEKQYSTCCSAETRKEMIGFVHSQCTTFSSREATIFLSRRWKDTIARDHVKLVLCSEK
ncbi:hypothetical protein PR202_ga16728 [Eleusine coracana subsp. coracana]|uniref:Uncharacterized protein n=1 Tax=Eleusine coracana subsp. coracana TaxID=191504 RepID=A0AAV5CM71_ELECO|nr:hypothetical protein PR202_ga16728 [Eleusine coracana subsp. coracana]